MEIDIIYKDYFSASYIFYGNLIIIFLGTNEIIIILFLV